MRVGVGHQAGHGGAAGAHGERLAEARAAQDGGHLGNQRAHDICVGGRVRAAGRQRARVRRRAPLLEIRKVQRGLPHARARPPPSSDRVEPRGASAFRMLFTHGGCLWRNSKPGRSRAHAPQRLRQQQRCTARGRRICARPLEPEPLEPAPVPRTVRLPVPLPVYKGPHGGRDYQGGVRRRTSSALGSASAAQPPPAATAASKCECMADSTASTCGAAWVRVPTPAARAHRRRRRRRPPQPGLPCRPRLVQITAM